MRCFTLAAPGIRCRAGRIEVGEEGRGRTMVCVPISLQAVMDGDTLTECAGPATSALVLIQDQSGFRGNWRLRVALSPEMWDTTDPAGRRAVEQPFAGQIVAEGYGAQGDAGRMGGGPAYLLVLAHGQAVELVRNGRLYGANPVIRLECVAGCVVQSDPLADSQERVAAAKFAAASSPETGADAVEITVSWGGGTARNRAANWEQRPILVDGSGATHAFDGKDIPGVATVLADESIHRGPSGSRCAKYRVALHPGVSYRGNEVPPTVGGTEVKATS